MPSDISAKTMSSPFDFSSFVLTLVVAHLRAKSVLSSKAGSSVASGFASLPIKSTMYHLSSAVLIIAVASAFS